MIGEQTHSEGKFSITSVSIGQQYMTNHLLGLSFANREKDLVNTNVAGFICVKNVDMNSKVVTVLSPQPEPLPECLFVFSDIKFNNDFAEI